MIYLYKDIFSISNIIHDLINLYLYTIAYHNSALGLNQGSVSIHWINISIIFNWIIYNDM